MATTNRTTKCEKAPSRWTNSMDQEYYKGRRMSMDGGGSGPCVLVYYRGRPMCSTGLLRTDNDDYSSNSVLLQIHCDSYFRKEMKRYSPTTFLFPYRPKWSKWFECAPDQSERDGSVLDSQNTNRTGCTN